MIKIVQGFILLVCAANAFCEIYMGQETPDCWGKAIEVEDDVKCIVFFLTEFASEMNPLGDSWDVRVEQVDGVWIVYPKDASSQLPADAVLFRIDGLTGKPII